MLDNTTKSPKASQPSQRRPLRNVQPTKGIAQMRGKKFYLDIENVKSREFVMKHIPTLEGTIVAEWDDDSPPDVVVSDDKCSDVLEKHIGQPAYIKNLMPRLSQFLRSVVNLNLQFWSCHTFEQHIRKYRRMREDSRQSKAAPAQSSVKLMHGACQLKLEDDGFAPHIEVGDQVPVLHFGPNAGNSCFHRASPAQIARRQQEAQLPPDVLKLRRLRKRMALARKRPKRLYCEVCNQNVADYDEHFLPLGPHMLSVQRPGFFHEIDELVGSFNPLITAVPQTSSSSSSLFPASTLQRRPPRYMLDESVGQSVLPFPSSASASANPTIRFAFDHSPSPPRRDDLGAVVVATTTAAAAAVHEH